MDWTRFNADQLKVLREMSPEQISVLTMSQFNDLGASSLNASNLNANNNSLNNSLTTSQANGPAITRSSIFTREQLLWNYLIDIPPYTPNINNIENAISIYGHDRTTSPNSYYDACKRLKVLQEHTVVPNDEFVRLMEKYSDFKIIILDKREQILYCNKRYLTSKYRNNFHMACEDKCCCGDPTCIYAAYNGANCVQFFDKWLEDESNRRYDDYFGIYQQYDAKTPNVVVLDTDAYATMTKLPREKVK